MKLLILSLFIVFEAAWGQFGRFTGNGGGSCDYQALMQAVVQKDRCFKEFLDMKKEAMQAIQRMDPSCNRGILDSWQQCEPIFEPWLEQNDLSASGIMECCFGSRVGGSSRRQCDFKDKPMPKSGRKGKKGKKGKGGKSGEKGPGGPRGMMDPMMREWERKMAAKKTLAGLGLISMEQTVEMIGHMFWCMEEERPIELSAAEGPFREYKDKMIAKAWECYGPMMQVATNCTEVQAEDIECIQKGMEWNELFKMDCIHSCHPDSLSSFCNFFTQGQNQAVNGRFNSGTSSSNSFSNSRQGNNNNNRNNWRSQGRNQDANDFFDPFGY